MSKAIIYNEQKVDCWGGFGWTTKMFYLYSDGKVQELAPRVRGEFTKPPRLLGGRIIARLVCRSKCDHAETTRTGKLTFKK